MLSYKRAINQKQPNITIHKVEILDISYSILESDIFHSVPIVTVTNATIKKGIVIKPSILINFLIFILIYFCSQDRI